MAADSLPDEGRAAKLQGVAPADVYLDGTSEDMELSDAQEECNTSEASQEYEMPEEILAGDPILVCTA